MAESLSASNVSSLALTGVHYCLHWQFIFNLKPKNNDSLITGKLVQVTLKAIHKSHSAANNGKVSILQCITYKTINMKQGLQTMMFDMCIMPLQASMYCFRSLSCIVKHHKSFISTGIQTFTNNQWWLEPTDNNINSTNNIPATIKTSTNKILHSWQLTQDWAVQRRTICIICHKASQDTS